MILMTILMMIWMMMMIGTISSYTYFLFITAILPWVLFGRSVEGNLCYIPFCILLMYMYLDYFAVGSIYWNFTVI